MSSSNRHLNRVRVTRDPDVATAYDQAQEMSADWDLALIDALRNVASNAEPAPATGRQATHQLSLPFTEATPIR